MDCIKRINELETLFSDNKYDGRGDSAFHIDNGEIPIMVSAPHAINQYREGKIKWADMYTGGIAKYLSETTRCHAIYSCMFTESDPNYDEGDNNRYQLELKKYVNDNNIKLLLDLHGAAKNREYAVEMGTAPNNKDENTKNEDPSLHEYKYIDDVLKIVFEKNFKNLLIKQKKVWKNVIFNAGEQNTVTKYISENTNTACVQLEINGNYRDPENEKEFCSLIRSLTEIINFFSDVNWEVDEQEFWEIYKGCI